VDFRVFFHSIAVVDGTKGIPLRIIYKQGIPFNVFVFGVVAI